MDIKKQIRKMLREHCVELSVVDETSLTTTYTIKYKDRDAGQVVLTNKDETDIEILVVHLHSNYQEMAMTIVKELITTIWITNEKAQTIFVQPNPESRGFWAKMGGNRLNNTYHIIQRGH